MKHLFCTCAVMLSALALTACSNESEVLQSVEQPAVQEVELKASVGGSQTRTHIGAGGEGETTGCSYWDENDFIYVWAGNMDAPSLSGELQFSNYNDDSNHSSATFKGFIAGYGGVEDLKYALYPVPTTLNDGRKGFKLLDNSEPMNSYLFPAPMFGVIQYGSSGVSFRYLCGMLRINVTLPEGMALESLMMRSNSRFVKEAYLENIDGQSDVLPNLISLNEDETPDENFYDNYDWDNSIDSEHYLYLNPINSYSYSESESAGVTYRTYYFDIPVIKDFSFQMKIKYNGSIEYTTPVLNTGFTDTDYIEGRMIEQNITYTEEGITADFNNQSY